MIAEWRLVPKIPSRHLSSLSPQKLSETAAGSNPASATTFKEPLMSNFFADAVAPVHDRLDKIEARLNATTSAILQALHHIISKGTTDMDHDALLALAKEIDGKADAAVSEFNTLSADHGAKAQALDDIGTVLTGIGTKLDGIKAPATAMDLSASQQVSS